MRREQGLEPYPTERVTADLADWVRPLRPARCNWRIDENVGVHGQPGFTSHYSGTERCGSVWACPVCSAVIRNQRAEDIEAAARNWQDQGGSLLFLTLTARHKKSESLATTLDAVLKSWSSVIRGEPWKKIAAKIDLRGFIRATEVTWGEANGWHPHLHILLFVKKQPSAAQLADFENKVYERWRDRLVARGLGEPTRLRGIDLRTVYGNGELLAQYLSKVQGESLSTAATTSVHMELARSDMKSTRGKKAGGLSATRLTPFEMLDDDVPLPQRRAESLWCEYVSATRGRRAFHWSKGLRELVKLDQTEKTDDEILAEVKTAQRQFSIPAMLWDELRSFPDQLAAILDAMDRGSAPAAEALSRGDLLVMADGQFWVDAQTARCFTPAEAIEFFGQMYYEAPEEAVAPTPEPEEVLAKWAARREKTRKERIKRLIQKPKPRKKRPDPIAERAQSSESESRSSSADE